MNVSNIYWLRKAPKPSKENRIEVGNKRIDMRASHGADGAVSVSN